VAGPRGEPLRLVRLVFDSARIMSSLEEVVLDEKMKPKELHKPLEVMVRVFPNPPGLQGKASGTDLQAEGRDDFGNEEPGEGGRPLVTLLLKLPEYKWY
jgi:hypothetical protein